MLLKVGGIIKAVGKDTITMGNLPNEVFGIGRDTDGYFLRPIKEKFSEPDDYDDSFFGSKLDYLVKRAQAETGNVGYLFSGVKGMGKTLLMEMIANRMNLPVIIVETNSIADNNNLFQFLFALETSMVIIIDEFEKKLSNVAQEQLLSFFDGIYNSDKKKVFLLSCNEDNINDAFIGRLGRILYKVPFYAISDKNVCVRFMKKHTSLSDNEIDLLVDMLSTKQTITIDILHKIAKELRLTDFKSFVEIGWPIINLEDTIYDIYCETYDYNEDEPQNNPHNRPLADFVEVMSLSFNEKEAFLEKLRKAREANPEFEPDTKDEMKEDYYIGSDGRWFTTKKVLSEMKVGDNLDGNNYVVKSIERRKNIVFMLIVETNDETSGYYCKVNRFRGVPAFGLVSEKFA